MKKLTPARRRNLERLAAHLDALPTDYGQFNMARFYINADADFSYDDDLPVNGSPACGTVACAVGHGPGAGVRPRRGEDWYEYAKRVFTGGDWPTFDFLFSDDWAKFDNTPHGAARRIRHLLANGIPWDWHYSDPEWAALSQARGEG